MKFTLGWLKEHLEFDDSLEQVSERLTAIGLEVEAIDDPRKKLAPFVIAHVVDCKKHPDADRLKVCSVDTGNGKIVQVVCGAPNARKGMKGVFVAPGNTVPGTGVELKSGNLRGVASNGMLCSERELEISNEHDGIIDLPEDAPTGENFAQYWGLIDPVIEIGLTPNRGDCAGVRGIAQDLAASGLGTLKPLKIPTLKETFEGLAWEISPEASKNCPWVVGRSFQISHNPPAPKWMQQRLTAIGLRPISALVDMTNYITYDLGRPLHVFDADKLVGKSLIIHQAKGGEEISALNGNIYTLSEGDTVISDGKGVVSVAGIMGGEESCCDENTKNVFLECALFEANSIAKTGRRLQIDSDARFRFDRKVAPSTMEVGIAYASALINKICGGSASTIVQAGKKPALPTPITLRLSRLNSYTGIDIPLSVAHGLLENLGCHVESNNDNLIVTPPDRRPDIEQEVCLIEEVIRLFGYDKIPSVSLPNLPFNHSTILKPHQRRISLIRRSLANAGLDEVINLSFCAENLASALSNGKPLVKIANPINAEMSFMRPTPLSGLLEACRDNFDQYRRPLHIFQIGPGWVRTETNDDQVNMACALRLNAHLHWKNNTLGGNDPFTVKADVMTVLQLCGIEQPALHNEAPAHYHPYRSGTLSLGKKPVAYFGNLHPEIVQLLGLKLPKETRIAAFEILLDNLPPAKRKPASKAPLVKYALQPVTRDLSFAVPTDFAAGELIRMIQAVDKKLIKQVQLFDEYCEGDTRAVAYRVSIQPQQQSLTEEDLQKICQKIIDHVQKNSSAILR